MPTDHNEDEVPELVDVHVVGISIHDGAERRADHADDQEPHQIGVLSKMAADVKTASVCRQHGSIESTKQDLSLVVNALIGAAVWCSTRI